MNLLLHDFGRHAFPLQLSRELAKRGHIVTHLYAQENNTPLANLESKADDPTSFTCKAMDTGKTYQKYSFYQRWKQEQAYAKLLAETIRQHKPDVVLECTGPTDGHWQALIASHQVSARYVYWLQDINGLASKRILSKKLPVVGGWVGDYYIRMERRVLQKSDRVVSISPDFQQILDAWSIPPKKVDVIPNWAPLNCMPQYSKINPWAIKHHLVDTFTFLYAGSLGLKHNPELFVQLAKHFQQDPKVKVIVISEGLGASWLKDQIAAEGIQNLTVLPYQTFDEFPQVLASANVLVSILEPDAGVFSVPSKVNSYFCAGRPLLLSIPRENLAARLVTANNAGLVAEPGDVENFIGQADALYQSSELCLSMGKNARAYAEEHFQISPIADQFERLLFGKL